VVVQSGETSIRKAGSVKPAELAYLKRVSMRQPEGEARREAKKGKREEGGLELQSRTRIHGGASAITTSLKGSKGHQRKADEKNHAPDDSS